MQPLEIVLNGERKNIPRAMNLSELIAHFGFDARMVAIGRNEAVVPKVQHALTQVGAGDRIDIVHFVAGG